MLFLLVYTAIMLTLTAYKIHRALDEILLDIRSRP